MIWHIWWLAAAGLVGGIAIFIKRCYASDVDYYAQPNEVVRIEQAHNLSATILATDKELNA